jgi:uncharacterized protein (TIGR02266 family)
MRHGLTVSDCLEAVNSGRGAFHGNNGEGTHVSDEQSKLEQERARIREDYARRRALLERRRHTRIDARVPVLFETPNDYVEAYTHNLSKGGLYFETPERLSPNGRLELVLRPPGSDEEVKVIARVVRMITKYHYPPTGDRVRVNGYGVRFEKISDSDQRLLESFFQELSGENETG